MQSSVPPELLATIKNLFQLVAFRLVSLQLVHSSSKICIVFFLLLDFLL